MSRRSLLVSLMSLFVIPAFGAAAIDPFEHPLVDEPTMRAMLSQPAAKLSKAQVLRGEFTHSRYLSEVPRPLVATGEFIFVRDLGVYWHTRQPFDSIVVLTRQGLAQVDEGGQTQRIATGEQPAVRFVANIFMALFTLDIASLRRDFDMYGGQREGRWVIGLKPRAKVIASVFSQATVSGAEDVEQVVLTDAKGDRTVIDLRGVDYSSGPAGADVRALFALPAP